MKKEEERFFLDRFLENFPRLRLSSIQQHESPDFICVSEGKTIGVEITKFFHKGTDSNLSQARHSYRRRFSREIIEEHKRRKLPPLHVSVHFDSDRILMTKEGRDCVKNALLNYVSQPDILGKTQFVRDFLYTDILRSEFSIGGIHIVKSESLTKPFWSVPHAEFIPDTSPSVIQEVVATKSIKLEGYKKELEEQWLLIIAGTGGLNSTIHFEKGFEDAIYETKFDRVFIFSLFGPFACELNIA